MIGVFPNLKWDLVTPPDFLESYAKYPWAYKSVLSPMILIEFLLAPTVPSAPSPKNRHSLTSGLVTDIGAPTSSEVKVTSSTIPTVNLFLGWSNLSFQILQLLEQV